MYSHLGVSYMISTQGIKNVRIYALDYYRRNLKNKVMNGSEIPIDYVDPNVCISNPKNSFCEFDNYTIEKSEIEMNINNTN